MVSRDRHRSAASSHGLPHSTHVGGVTVTGHALELLLLIRDQQPDRYDRAAARWLARYCVEVPGVDLSEATLTAGALTALAAPEEKVGAFALVALAHQRRLRDVERVLRRSLSLGSDDAS
jgi:hypothetical protein